MSLALLLTCGAATVVGAAALHAAHGLRRQVTALRAELAAHDAGPPAASVPQARPTPAAEIRAAVAEALAEASGRAGRDDLCPAARSALVGPVRHP